MSAGFQATRNHRAERFGKWGLPPFSKNRRAVSALAAAETAPHTSKNASCLNNPLDSWPRSQ
jgi:hypothetical protein